MITNTTTKNKILNIIKTDALNIYCDTQQLSNINPLLLNDKTFIYDFIKTTRGISFSNDVKLHIIYGLFYYMSIDLQNDKDFILTILNKYHIDVIFNTIDDSMKLDRDIFKSLLQLDDICIDLLDDDNLHITKQMIYNDKELIELIFKQPISSIENIWDIIDPSIITDTAWTNIQSFSQVFKYFSENLKDDYTISWEAVRLNGENLEYVSDRLKDDIPLVKLAYNQNIDNLKYASDRIKENPILLKL